jgi:hypothetical protein
MRIVIFLKEFGGLEDLIFSGFLIKKAGFGMQSASMTDHRYKPRYNLN